MHRAPQETRTYFVTAITAQRRRLFQVTANAELLQSTILNYHAQNRFLLAGGPPQLEPETAPS